MDSLRTIYGLMTRARRRHLAATLLLMLVGTLAELVTIGAVIPFLALAADPGGARIGAGLRRMLDFAGEPVAGAAILLVGAAIVAAGVRLLLNWSSQSFVAKLGHEIASAIYSRTLRQPYAEYLRRNSSEVLSGMEKVHGVVFGFVQPVMQGAIATAMAIVLGLFLLSIEPLATAAGAAAILGAYALMSRFTRGRLKRNARTAAAAMTERTKIVQEGMGGIRDIILERSQPLFEARFRAIDRRFRDATAVNAFIASSPRFVIEAAGIAAIAAATLAMSLRTGGIAAALPVLGALALGAQRLLPLMQQAWFGWSQAASNSGVLADIAALLRSDPPAPAPAAAPLPFREEIVFDRVSFRHPGAAFAVEQVGFRIGRGEKVAIAGPTGSGKSTLLDLLMGLIEPDAGEIRIDGRRLDQETRPAWHAAIAHVPQSIYLADDTIAANIAFAAPGEPDMMRIEAAARAACLDGFIDGLPDRYQTRVGERGIRLSGGQRQRIGLARALYKGACVLILDEATSALDDATEAAVLRSIAAFPGERTLIMVAHRASTLAACDRILRMEAGRLVSS